ncbi:unnamed protein product [Mytilus coruscus]|uniref:CCHC-type domain-containing protein n=1 Tax=Mytilus coruscus TaxID=42192 RepID=A0A6J8BFS3_MYTCO|nr:unnamed protein product [Mytilus coruscus]
MGNLMSEIQKLSCAVKNSARPGFIGPSPRSPEGCCFHCSEVGHLKREWPKFLRASSPKPGGKKVTFEDTKGKLDLENQITGTEEGDPINDTSTVMSCSKLETPLTRLELSETMQSCEDESEKLGDKSLGPHQSLIGVIDQSETPVHEQEGDTAVFRAEVVENQAEGAGRLSERGGAPDHWVSTMSGLEWEAHFSRFELLKEDDCSKLKVGEGGLFLMPAGTQDMLREVETWEERVERAEAEAQMNGEQSQQWDPGVAFLEHCESPHNQQLLTVHSLLENNGVCGILGNSQREGKGVIQKEDMEGILPTQAAQFDYDFQF